MKITLIELRMIIREEILAEKLRRRKKKKDVFQNDMNYYRKKYQKPISAEKSLYRRKKRRERFDGRDEDYEMYYSGIQLMWYFIFLKHKNILYIPALLSYQYLLYV